MKFYSTNKNSSPVTFEEALMKGLAPDGGLYMPEFIPQIEKHFFEQLSSKTFQEIAFEIAQKFIETEIDKKNLMEIINESINFPAPLVQIDENISILELFHGPTLAFKDFGARFMAKSMAHFISKQNRALNILVATSGDTGSAVANGFYNTPGINVFILYPKERISYIQEKQLATLDNNVIALEIDGTFDDCQNFVKSAFVDYELNKKLNLSSANSINIARLLPQTFYYFEAFKQIKNNPREIIFCVPSGNLGNLTAGLIANKMGLPITKFIAATNSNTAFVDFLNSGQFTPRNSIQTLSNAMDVGIPSNLDRIRALFSGDIKRIKEIIYSNFGNDSDTVNTIKQVYYKYNYVLDPHGAVGFFVLNKFLQHKKFEKHTAILLETAHPAKFIDTVEGAINSKIEIPLTLKECLRKGKKSICISSYKEFKNYLLDTAN